ncbi:hypothetical protein N0V93_009860 [Gnomoniopsis smithogilvyi]|uniref:Heterokaryon incompatibility domain-containing protein n=1 Tax=Gnomoniopsis smithogilvyi TaxID=1191159 RepID=A0A9W8YIQ9_9PEZI|nr:hypothetical protein N0V93_009860 [Gnomoniopsis smithogilvyi]
MLCEVCRGVFSYRGSDKYGYNNQIGGHHTDTLSLSKAASSGCKICTQIEQRALTELQVRTLENVEMRFRITEVVVDQSDEGTISAQVEYLMIVPGPNGKQKTELWRYLSIFAVARPKRPISTNVGKRQPDASLPISVVAQLARAYVKGCVDGHAQCTARMASTFYPTRLVALSEFTARIIHPSIDGAKGPYVALSYCWGPDPKFLKLTASNKNELQASFPLKCLPIAFQEAIDLVKSLGYRYIWIDSLCILQEGAGSKDDWRSESSRMADVYSNCILNLSLSRASCPEESSLGGKGAYPLLPPFAVQLGDESFIMFDQEHYRFAFYRQPLGLRAWTFQERVLAPRVLALGQGEVFWDCLELREASESFPLGLAPSVSAVLGAAQLEITIPTTKLPLHEFYSHWQRVLDNYTPRNITYVEKDKLIALGAVASRMCRVQNDVYIAGHFLSTLPYSLLWRLHNTNDGEKWSGTNGKRVPSSTASINTPSWSWASIDGPVRHYTGSQPASKDMWPNCLATLRSHTLDLEDELNPFGQCRSASITISTVCTEIVWSQATSGWQLLDRTKTLEDYNKWGDPVFIVWLDDPDQRHNMIDGSHFTLAAFCDGYMVGSDQPARQGLVLQEIVECSRTVYRRVAHFRLGAREKPKAGQTLAEFESAQIRRGWKEVKEIFETENRTLVLV